jgi:hypothetical protein
MALGGHNGHKPDASGVHPPTIAPTSSHALVRRKLLAIASSWLLQIASCTAGKIGRWTFETFVIGILLRCVQGGAARERSCANAMCVEGHPRASTVRRGRPGQVLDEARRHQCGARA